MSTTTAAFVVAFGVAGAGWLAAGPCLPSRAVPAAASARATTRGLSTPAGMALGALILIGAVVGASGRWRLGVALPLALPLGLAFAVAACTSWWLVRRARDRSARRCVHGQVVEACDALTSALRAGLPPERVLSRTAEDVPLLVPAASAACLGGDVAKELRSAARLPGAERLAMMAAAWEVAQRSGAGLADVVATVSSAVRADAGRERQMEAALGGARSTARLFAVLPALGVALGVGMGADPIGVLTTSPAGAWCLAVGTGLAAAGLTWVERLSDAAR